METTQKEWHLGDPCDEEAEQCCELANAECWMGKCTCKEGYYTAVQEPKSCNELPSLSDVIRVDVAGCNSTSISLNCTVKCGNRQSPGPGTTTYILTVTDLGSRYYNDSDKNVTQQWSYTVPGYNTSRYVITDLSPYWKYNISLMANTSRLTEYANLNVDPVNATALHVTWDPPHVPNESELKLQRNAGTSHHRHFTYRKPIYYLERRCHGYRHALQWSWIRREKTRGNTTLPAAIPSTPTGFEVLKTTATNVTVVWEPPKPWPSTTTYILTVTDLGSRYYNDSDKNVTQQWSYTVPGYNTSRYVITDLSPYWKYNISLMANTSAGNSSAQYKVRNLNVDPVNATALHVTWDPPHVPNGHLMAYIIQLSPKNRPCREYILTLNSAYEVPSLNSNCSEMPERLVITDTSLTATNLLPESVVTVTVTPYNGAGLGEKNTGNTTLPAAVPSTPPGFEVQETTATNVTVVWEPPTPWPGTTTYILTVTDLGSRYYNDSDKNVTQQWSYTVPGYNTSRYVITDLSPYWKYNISLMANTSAGNSSAQYKEALTNESASHRVRNLHVDPVNATALHVTWDPPHVPNGHLMAYIIQLSPKNRPCREYILTLNSAYEVPSLNSNCSESPERLVITDTSLTATNLLPESVVTVTVTPYNGAGLGEKNTGNITLPAAVPSTPPGFEVQETTATNVTVVWEPPTPWPGTTTYILTVTDLGSRYYNDSDKNVTQQWSYTVPGYNTSEYVITSLSPYWKYNISLMARTSAGDSSARYKAAMTDESVPSEVPELKAGRHGDSYVQVDVNWTCPSLRQRNTNITGFSLAVLEVVSTLGQHQNSSSSTLCRYFAPTGPSHKVWNLHVDPVNATALHVTWDPPHVPNGHLMAYIIQLSPKNRPCREYILTLNSAYEVPSLNSNCSEMPERLVITDTSLTATNLLPESVVTVTVTPYNAAGLGEKNTGNITLPAAVPSTPTGFEVLKTTATSVTVVWEPPKTWPGTTTYILTVTDLGSRYYNDSDKKVTQQWSYPVPGYNTSRYVITDLSPYWKYNISLMANTSAGNSSTQYQDTLTNESGQHLGQHQNSINSTSLRYFAPPGPSSKVEDLQNLTKSCAVSLQVENFTYDNTWFVVEHLSPETTYNVTVIPVNAAGEGQTNHREVVVPAGRSEQVENLDVNSTTAFSVNLSWTKPVITNGDISAFVLAVNDSSGQCLNWTVFSNKRKLSILDSECNSPPTKERFPTVFPMVYSVQGLCPDTDYSLTLYPVNGAGYGDPRNVSIRTQVAVPNQPTAFNVKASDPFNVIVGWEPPHPRPGPTNYTLNITKSDNPYNYSGYSPDRVIIITGYNNRSARVGNLRSGWEYHFELKAVTSAGPSHSISKPFLTPESQPGKVQRLNVIRVETGYRQALVTWDYPELLQRHGNITSFTLTYFQEPSNLQILQNQYTVSAEEKKYSDIVDVHPGSHYRFEVTANNEKFTGKDTIFTYTAPVGLPYLPTLPPDTTISTKETSLARSQSTFSVSFCASCLLNDTNGDITFVAAIVCAAEYCKNDTLASLVAFSKEDAVRNIPSWHDAKKDGFRKYYRPTEDSWERNIQSLRARRKRATGRDIVPSVFVVGNDTSCPQTPDYIHCNGPLPAENPTDPVPGIVGELLGDAVRRCGCRVWGCSLYLRRRSCPNRWTECPKEKRNWKKYLAEGRPVLMRDFEEKLREWKAAKDDNGFPMFFLTQFNELKSMSPNPKREAALRDENKPKNRYTNILPYDHSRVKLTLLDDDDTCDYINANYIPGYHSKREYIATQGPLESTVHDFWRMVWEQRSTVIVMLSGLKEKNVVKVHQYYPDDDQLDEPQECGCVTVTLTKVQKMPDFIVKTFQVVVGRERRTVKQFYIDTWRDFDATSTQASFWSLPGPYAPMRHLAGNTLS
ncbi:hypothetical protein BaRGS_00005520 [Batillaria attramentaria]|uniref:Protein-tyrosine-phosphatase n=1 Tax=Batillaria attramentaria TaxID=370345 RepID=A0ABD0LUC7_9CAEN